MKTEDETEDVLIPITPEFLERAGQAFSTMFQKSMMDQMGYEQCMLCEGWFTKNVPHACVSGKKREMNTFSG